MKKSWWSFVMSDRSFWNTPCLGTWKQLIFPIYHSKRNISSPKHLIPCINVTTRWNSRGLPISLVSAKFLHQIKIKANYNPFQLLQFVIFVDYHTKISYNQVPSPSNYVGKLHYSHHPAPHSSITKNLSFCLRSNKTIIKFQVSSKSCPFLTKH